LAGREARYGAKNRFRDVTKLLKGYVRDGVIDIVVDNDTMGDDPYRGTSKALHVTFLVGTEEKELVVQEGERLRLP